MKNVYVNEHGNVIEYEEGFWTGNKIIVIDGQVLQKTNKKVFVYNETPYTIKGNFFTGVKLTGINEIVIVPKLKVWEYILAVLPLFLVLVGGAIGGVLGALGAIGIASGMRKFQNVFVKILFALGVTAIVALAWYLTAYVLLASLYPVI